jgi:putative DNA primase/helicase
MRVLDLYPWIAADFQDAREEQNGAQVSVACPMRCHRSARVRFAIGEDDCLMFMCMAGCNKLEILRAVGRSFKDCFRDRLIPDNVKRDITALYQYRDEAGKVLYEVARFEPGFHGREKDLRPRHPVAGRMEWGLPKEIRRVLYRLPELLASNSARTVLVVAGEKDVDSLARIGVLATTNVFGERAEWLPEYSGHLALRDVVVVPDADSAGSRHGDEVVGSLIRHGVKSLRVAGLPKKDATAFLNALRVQGVTDAEDLRRELWLTLSLANQWIPAQTGPRVETAQ